MAISKDIVERDHQLSTIVETKQGEADDAQLDLDQHRWEQVKCPKNKNPVTQKAYADAVGLSPDAISVSVRTVTKLYRTIDSGCTDPAHGKVSKTDKPSKADHQKARQQVQKGDEATLVNDALADAFGVAVSTVAQNANWKDRRNEALVSARERADGDVTAEDAEEVAEALKKAFDLVKDYKANILKRMKANRAVKKGVGAAMVDDTFNKAVVKAQTKSISVWDAIDELIEWDHKACEAERLKNERAANRNRAISNLEYEISKGVSHFLNANKILIEDRNLLDLDDDEMEDFGNLIASGRGFLNLIDLFVTGDGKGIDWDAENKRLQTEMEVE